MNYIVDLSEKRNKATKYPVNLLKSFYKRPAFVNLITDMDAEEVEKDAEIPYTMQNPTQIDFWEL